MISLFPLAKATSAAIGKQVHELAEMLVGLVELILMSLFW